MREAGILVLLLAAFVGKASSSKCGDNFSLPNGTITVDPAAPAGQDCVFTISRNKTNPQIVLNIKNIALTVNDTLTIFDGSPADKKTIVKYTSASLVSFQVAVGFAENTTIIFKPSESSTKSQFAIDYDLTGCTINLKNSYDRSITAPLYVPTAGKNFNCKYMVTNDLPSGQLAVASVADLQLQKDSSLVLSSGDQNTTYTGASPQDDFFGGEGKDMAISFTVSDTNTSQTFSLLVESVASDCSGVVQINKTFPVVKTFEDNPVNHKCRWQVKTSESSLLTHITSLSIIPGSDKVVFIDGGSSLGNVLASPSDSLDKSDYLVTSTHNVMTISATLTGKIGPRHVKFTLDPAAYQSRLTDSGSLLVGAGKTTPPKEAYFQLVAKENEVVKVEIVDAGNATATFYNGLQTTDPVWAVFKAASQDLKTVIGGAQMLVKVTNLQDKAKFNATFSSIPAGCDMIATSDSGQLTYSTKQVLAKEQTCTWTIAPLDAKGTLVVDINSVHLEKGETLTVYAGMDNKKIVEKVEGPLGMNSKLPQLHVQAADKMRVVINRPATNSTATKVSLQYQVVSQACGSKLDQPLNSLGTPNFPNQYPLNAMCMWTVGSTPNTTAFVHINFKSLSLAEGDSISVTNGTGAVLASYGGVSQTPDQLPADLILPKAKNNTIAIQFQSVPKVNKTLAQQVSSGAEWDTRLLTCGGNITKGSGSFKSPGHPKSPTSSVYCLWIVDVKGKDGDMPSVVNYTFKVSDKAKADLGKYLKIYDGNSLRTEPKAFNTSFMKPQLSYLKRLIVVFDYTKASNEDEMAFELDFSTYDCNATCETTGRCLHPAWRCNGINDCGDNTDEVDCKSVPVPPKPPKTKEKNNTGITIACFFIGLIVGAALLFVIPRIVRRLRGREGNYSRMADERGPVVT